MSTQVYQIVDNRVCIQCGCRAGHCDHLESIAYEKEMTVPAKLGRQDFGVPWSEQELEQLEAMWADGMTSTRIAELLNRSRSAVVGVVYRMGFKRAA